MKTQSEILKTDFFNVGKEFLQTEEDTKTVMNEKTGLQWIPLQGTLTLPFSQGEGIKSAIRDLNLPKVSKISYGGGFGLSCEPSAGYGFYGIEANYKDCTIRVFLLDTGCSITPLFADHYNRQILPSDYVNGYLIRFNSMFNKYIVSHDEVGAGLAEFDKLSEAKQYCLNG